MFAAAGLAGLWVIQQLGGRQQTTSSSSSSAGAVAAVAAQHSTPTKHDTADTAAASASPGSPLRRALGFGRGGSIALKELKDGGLVCFKDRTGQLATVTPVGSGSAFSLQVTCASGGCATLPHGVGSLPYVGSDSLFLARQVGSSWAFLSVGAGGRFLAAVRDLNAAAVLDSSRLTPSAQWRVSGHGMTNAHHTHKKLAFTVHPLWPVHVEAVAAAELGITSLATRLQAEVAAAEAANRSLTAQLQEAGRQGARAAAEHDSRVSQMGKQLGDACAFSSQLAALLEQRDSQVAALREHVAQHKHKHMAAERELSAAYGEVAALQAALQERDDDIAQLQDRMDGDAHQRDQARAELQDALAARDDEIASLSLQLQRMESALRAVEQMAVGMRRPRRLDRASLDAVSIHQLQAAVDHFGAGDARSRVQQGNATSPQEAEALRVLLEQQAGGLASVGLELEGFEDLGVDPGTELPVHDLEHTDQTSPRKQAPDAARLTGGSNSKAGPSWDAAGVSTSRGARSSGSHRYSADASDDGSDEEGEAVEGSRSQEQEPVERSAPGRGGCRRGRSRSSSSCSSRGMPQALPSQQPAAVPAAAPPSLRKAAAAGG